MSATVTARRSAVATTTAAGRRPLLPGIAAAGIAATAFVTAGVIRATYPFGDSSRSIGDLGQQIIPMYAHHRDLVYGEAPGDLLFNWSSGFGVPYLADFMTYVGSTLSWIAVAFVLAMVGSFFLNSHFTYRVRPTVRRFLLFPLSNATNFVVTTAGVIVLVEFVGTNERLAPLIAAVVAIPVTFVVARTIMVGRLSGDPALDSSR